MGGAKHDESRYGGIYYSTDNGETWERTSFPDTISVRALAVQQQRHVFAGTFFGVLRSLDDGQTWSDINSGLRSYAGGPSVAAIGVNPVTKDLFIAVDFDGIYRSSNKGENWSSVGLDLPGDMVDYLIFNSLVFNSLGHAFAACGGYLREPEGIFYSTDNGQTWSQINKGLKNKTVFAIAVDDSDHVYVGTDGSGVFRTKRSTTQLIDICVFAPE